MNRKPIIALVATAASLAVLGGCKSNTLVGTWKSERAMQNLPAPEFDFASVTFAPDGTYTAEMVYGGRTMAQTGTWSYAADELVVGPQPTRRYGVDFKNPDTLSFSAQQGTVTMMRYVP